MPLGRDEALQNSDVERFRDVTAQAYGAQRYKARVEAIFAVLLFGKPGQDRSMLV